MLALFQPDRHPLLLKEIRTRMRARTVVVVENLYILAACGIVFFSVVVFGNLGEALGWEIGDSVFRTVTYVQAVLMLFVSPLVAASAVSGEKEQKTYDTLCATPVSARRIVWAKLAAVLSCFLILIAVSLPIVCISFILGGVAPGDVALAYACTILCTATAGAMGVYWSTRFERSIASIPAASICAVLVVIIAPVAARMHFTGLSMISPLVFLNGLYGEAVIPFFGGRCPFWAPSFAFLAVLFGGLVTASSVRLRFPGDRRYVLLRLIALALFAGVAAFIAGENVAPAGTPAEARRRLSPMLWTYFVLLLGAGPWLGANTAVSQSEDRGGAGRSRLVRLLRKLLVKAAPFSALLVLTGAAFVALALRVVGPSGPPAVTVWLVYGGAVGLSTMTWTLLSCRLSDRRTARGRIMGMAGAYAAALALVIAPAVIWGVAASRSLNGVPAWVQYTALLSPVPALSSVGDPHGFAEQFSAVVGAFGPAGPVLLTTGLYLAASLILSVLSLGRAGFRGKSRAGAEPFR